MGRLEIIAAELRDDPLARGYDVMTAEEAAISLNTENVDVSYARPVVEIETLVRAAGKWIAFKERADAREPDGSSTNPAIRELMDLFGSRVETVNFDDGGYWNSLLTAAVTEGSLGAGAANAFRASCHKNISRAAYIGLDGPVLTPEVRWARDINAALESASSAQA